MQGVGGGEGLAQRIRRLEPHRHGATHPVDEAIRQARVDRPERLDQECGVAGLGDQLQARAVAVEQRDPAGEGVRRDHALVHEHLGDLLRRARLREVARHLLQQGGPVGRALGGGPRGDGLGEQLGALDGGGAVVGERLGVGDVLLGQPGLLVGEREADHAEQAAAAAQRHGHENAEGEGIGHLVGEAAAALLVPAHDHGASLAVGGSRRDPGVERDPRPGLHHLVVVAAIAGKPQLGSVSRGQHHEGAARPEHLEALLEHRRDDLLLAERVGEGRGQLGQAGEAGERGVHRRRGYATPESRKVRCSRSISRAITRRWI